MYYQNIILDDDQNKINSYFEIAKSKDLNFANNIGDYMFMHRTQDKLFLKIEYQENIINVIINYGF